MPAFNRDPAFIHSLVRLYPAFIRGPAFIRRRRLIEEKRYTRKRYSVGLADSPHAVLLQVNDNTLVKLYSLFKNGVHLRKYVCTIIYIYIVSAAN